MRLPGGMEWVIVLVIILLLFGPGRIGKIFGELGKGIRNFREGLGSKDKPDEEQSTDSSGNIEPK